MQLRSMQHSCRHKTANLYHRALVPNSLDSTLVGGWDTSLQIWGRENNLHHNSWKYRVIQAQHVPLITLCKKNKFYNDYTAYKNWICVIRFYNVMCLGRLCLVLLFLTAGSKWMSCCAPGLVTCTGGWGTQCHSLEGHCHLIAAVLLDCSLRARIIWDHL